MLSCLNRRQNSFYLTLQLHHHANACFSLTRCNRFHIGIIEFRVIMSQKEIISQKSNLIIVVLLGILYLYRSEYETFQLEERKKDILPRQSLLLLFLVLFFALNSSLLLRLLTAILHFREKHV